MILQSNYLIKIFFVIFVFAVCEANTEPPKIKVGNNYLPNDPFLIELLVSQTISCETTQDISLSVDFDTIDWFRVDLLTGEATSLNFDNVKYTNQDGGLKVVYSSDFVPFDGFGDIKYQCCKLSNSNRISCQDIIISDGRQVPFKFSNAAKITSKTFYLTGVLTFLLFLFY
jgi:hypothetical protein